MNSEKLFIFFKKNKDILHPKHFQSL